MKRRFRFRKLIVSRLFVTALSLLLQIGWFVLSISKLVEYSSAIDIFLRVLSLGMVIYIVCKEDSPSYKISWLILILLVPVFGGLLYAFVGNKKPTKRMHRDIGASRENLLCRLTEEETAKNELKRMEPRITSTSDYIRNVSGYPVCSCPEMKYYPFGENLFDDLIAELEKAEKFIFLEYFIISEGKLWDKVFDILKRKAENGVDIRIIYDDMGCVAVLPSGFYKRLEKVHPNIKCLAFNRVIPVFSLAMNNRDHRKIAVIDGKTAFSGGVNLADEYANINSPYGVWKDTGFMIMGRGAASFTEMFLELWHTFREKDDDTDRFFPQCEDEHTDGFVQPFYDTPLDTEELSENIYIDILNSAERYVYIFTPYLILDDNMKSALCLAAKRGVDVRIVTPGIPDKKAIYRLTRANYMPLLKAGVRIFEYTPGFLHAKSFIADDRVGVVGTINLDYRSLYLHFECGMLICGSSSLKPLYEDHVKTMEQSREITEKNIGQYFRGNMLDALLRMAAPLL